MKIFSQYPKSFLYNHELLFEAILNEDVKKIDDLIKEIPDLKAHKNPLYQTPYVFAMLQKKQRVCSLLTTENSEQDWVIYQEMQQLFAVIRKEDKVIDLKKMGYTKENFLIPDLISRNSAIFVAIDEKKDEWIKALYPFCSHHLSQDGKDILKYTLHVNPKMYKVITNLIN